MYYIVHNIIIDVSRRDAHAVIFFHEIFSSVNLQFVRETGTTTRVREFSFEMQCTAAYSDQIISSKNWFTDGVSAHIYLYIRFRWYSHIRFYCRPLHWPRRIYGCHIAAAKSSSRPIIIFDNSNNVSIHSYNAFVLFPKTCVNIRPPLAGYFVDFPDIRMRPRVEILMVCRTRWYECTWLASVQVTSAAADHEKFNFLT